MATLLEILGQANQAVSGAPNAGQQIQVAGGPIQFPEPSRRALEQRAIVGDLIGLLGQNIQTGVEGTGDLISQITPELAGTPSQSGSALAPAPNLPDIDAFTGATRPAPAVPQPVGEQSLGQIFNDLTGALQGGPNVQRPIAAPAETAAIAPQEPFVNDSAEEQEALIREAIPPLLEKFEPAELEQIEAGTATPEVEEKAKKSIFEDPAMGDLMLGVGIALLQGRGLGDALASGLQFQTSRAGARAAAKRQGALDEAEIGLKKAQTRKALADASKVAASAGLKGSGLKGFRSTFQTLVGEQPIGDDSAIQTAQAQAATTELAADPDNEALKKIQNDSLRVLFDQAASLEDEDERREAMNALGQQFPGFNFQQFF